MILLLRVFGLLILAVLFGFYPETIAAEPENSDETLSSWLEDRQAVPFLKFEERDSRRFDVKGLVDIEILKKWGTPDSVMRDQLKDSEVRLPICDLDHPPIEWRFVEDRDYSYRSVYRGAEVEGFHFLKWADGEWTRFFQDEMDYHQEGMICQNVLLKNPTRENYVQISLNMGVLDVVQQKKRVLPMLQNAILQMLIRTKENPEQITGQIYLSSAPSLQDGLLSLELWERNSRADWHLLKTVSGFIDDGHRDMTRWLVRAKVEPFSEVKMILKVDQSGLEVIRRSGFLSRLYIYEAILRKGS